MTKLEISFENIFIIILSIAIVISLFYGISSNINFNNEAKKEIKDFKLMNCEEEKAFLLKNLSENKEGIYPYTTEQALYEIGCLSK